MSPRLDSWWSGSFSLPGREFHPLEAPGLAWRTEKFFQVEIHHPAISFGDILLRLVYRLLRATPWSKTVAVFRERVPALLQNLQHCLLDKAVQDSGNAELAPSSAIRLLDFYSSHRLRLIGPVSQLFPDC